MLNNRTGFSLIEVIVAIFLISVGLVVVVSLINRTIYYTQSVSSRLAAVYLAQEGMEIVKNIRDSNFLNEVAWTSGLILGGSATTSSEFDYLSWSIPDDDCSGKSSLKPDGNGIYVCSSDSDAKFQREVTITPDGNNILDVLVNVSWEDKGKPYNVLVEERLYNWQ